jgi:hypothetical protein
MIDRNLIVRRALDRLSDLVGLVPREHQDRAYDLQAALEQALVGYGNALDALNQIEGKLFHATNDANRVAEKLVT